MLGDAQSVVEAGIPMGERGLLSLALALHFRVSTPGKALEPGPRSEGLPVCIYRQSEESG